MLIWFTGWFIRAVIFGWWVINGDLFILPILVFPGCPVGAVGWFRRCHVSIFVWGKWSRSTAISGVCKKLLCDEDLLCGVSHWWQYVLECLWHNVLLCVHLLYDLEWLLHELLRLWLLYLWLWEWDLDLLDLCPSQWSWQDVNLSWHLVLEWVFLCLAGVPDGGILSRQSATTWPYSSQSKHFIWGKWHALCPDSWHWKHLSSSLDMTFTEDEGGRVAVNCCAAWSFSTSLMASAKLCGPFL